MLSLFLEPAFFSLMSPPFPPHAPALILLFLAKVQPWFCAFSLIINNLPVSLPSSVSCSLYADELAIWSSSP